MDRELYLWETARRRQMFIRTYIVPNVMRIAVAVVGVGLGYILGHL